MTDTIEFYIKEQKWIAWIDDYNKLQIMEVI